MKAPSLKVGSASGSLEKGVTRCRLVTCPEAASTVSSSTSCRLWKTGSNRLV